MGDRQGTGPGVVISVARDPAFVAHAPEFAEVTGDDPALAEVDAHEGPVYFADENALYFTTLPRPGMDRTPSVEIKRLSSDEPGNVSVLMGGANGAKSMTADRAGRLIANRLSRTGQGFASILPTT